MKRCDGYSAIEQAALGEQVIGRPLSHVSVERSDWDMDEYVRLSMHA